MVELAMEEVAARVLIEHAREAAAHAYAPYSRFAVGAALLMEDGAIITGTNLENASYGLSLCAEAAALAAANGAGKLARVVAIGIVGGTIGAGGLTGDLPVYPCGRCRQMLHEAADLGARDIVVHCGSADGATVRRHLLSELLPHAFGPGDVGIATAP